MPTLLTPTLSQDFKNWIGGSGVTEVGIEIADFDGNGSAEIVTSSRTVPGNSDVPCYWYIVEQVDGVFQTTHISELLPNSINWLTILDYNRDGRPDICVSSSNKIHVYDGPTKNKIATIAAQRDIFQFAGADLDSDGVTEFVFADQSDMVVYSQNGIEQRVPSLAADRYAIGNLLPDRTPEIVLARMSESYVLNGRTRVPLISYPQGLGTGLAIADFNGDTIDDFITVSGGSQYTFIRGFTAISRTPVWQVHVPQGIKSFKVGDVDSDGSLEIVIATAGLDGLIVLNARTGAQKWALDYGEMAFGMIAVGNLDTDPTPEIALGSGVNSIGGRDGLDILDAKTRVLEWQSSDYSALLFAGHGDIDGDGHPEYLLISNSVNDYDGGAFLVKDSLTGFTEYSSSILPGRIQSASMANIDADPQLEIFVSYDNFGSKRICCYDGLTNSLQYQVSTGNLDTYELVAVDVDLDQDIELISRTSSNQITIRNAQNGALEWNSSTLPISASAIQVENIDSDPQLEIVASGNNLLVIDGNSRTVQWSTTGLGNVLCTTSDLDGDSVFEILVCSSSGRVTKRDPMSGAEASHLGTFGSGIGGFQVADVLGGPEPDIVLFQNGSILVNYRDASNQSLTFQAPSAVPSVMRFRTRDIDGDGSLNLILGTVSLGTTVYSFTR